MGKPQNLLIIGLDGATWDVLTPLIDEKKLPTLERLIKNGSFGILESTIPPVTGGAWLALATGKTPGRTGVIDFLNRRNSDFKLYPTSSEDFRDHSFWDYLSKANKKVGIFNYPMLFPPYEVKGFMISGLGAAPEEDITFPPSLKKELENVARPYQVSINYHDKKYDNLDLFIHDLNNFLDRFEKWTYHVVKNKEWNVLFLVFSVTDWVQHIMWRHIDETHPLHDPKVSPRYHEEFIKFWQRIDRILGNIMKMIPKDTIVVLVSDHGFGPNDQTFNLAKWLVMKGYMDRKRNIQKLIKRYAYRVATAIAKTSIRKLLPNKTRESVGNALRINITDEINFKKSKAYCLGHTIPFGAIYINASNDQERDKIKSQLVADLKNISRDIGREVKVQIYEPKKLYSGEKSDLLPDIIFTINNWRCVIIEDSFDRPLFEEKPFSPRHTGAHRLNGIFLAYGPGIKKGKRVDARIYDVAPTILHIFDLPIPTSIDGRVLMEIFEEDSEFAKRKPRYVDLNHYKKKREDEKLKNAIKNLKLKGKI